uniref:Uncharacterized protein n=1 Tax=Davidia involucrata TaxID=16924 RepID=A0A5B7AWI0_DAVIN
MITSFQILRGDKAHWKIVRFYRQQLIDQRVIVLRYRKLILFRKALIAGFRVFTGLIYRSFQRMVLPELLIWRCHCNSFQLLSEPSAGRDMDLLELPAYGNVRCAQDSGGCRIQ